MEFEEELTLQINQEQELLELDTLIRLITSGCSVV